MGTRQNATMRRMLAAALLTSYVLIYLGVLAFVLLWLPLDLPFRTGFTDAVPTMMVMVAGVGLIFFFFQRRLRCRACKASFLDASHVELRRWHLAVPGGPAIQAAWEVIAGRDHCMRCGAPFD